MIELFNACWRGGEREEIVAKKKKKNKLGIRTTDRAVDQRAAYAILGKFDRLPSGPSPL